MLSIGIGLATHPAFALEGAMSIALTPFGEDFAKDPKKGTLGLLPEDRNAYECSKPPTVDEIRTAGTFMTSLSVLTAEEAAKLKITFYGSATGTYDRKQQVVVSQAGRMKTCIAKDGQTELLYGHAVRTTILLSNYTVGVDASFAVVAAEATIKGATNKVELKAIGIPDNEVEVKLQEAKNSLGGQSLKVENFGDFNKKLVEAESVAVKSSKAAATLLGVSGERIDSLSISSSLARMYALSMIAEDKNCTYALKKFQGTDPNGSSLIQATYDKFAGGCDVASSVSAKARELLGAYRLK
jgi:hypothetical protein